MRKQRHSQRGECLTRTSTVKRFIWCAGRRIMFSCWRGFFFAVPSENQQSWRILVLFCCSLFLEWTHPNESQLSWKGRNKKLYSYLLVRNSHTERVFFSDLRYIFKSSWQISIAEIGVRFLLDFELAGNLGLSTLGLTGTRLYIVDGIKPSCKTAEAFPVETLITWKGLCSPGQVQWTGASVEMTICEKCSWKIKKHCA